MWEPSSAFFLPLFFIGGEIRAVWRELWNLLGFQGFLGLYLSFLAVRFVLILCLCRFLYLTCLNSLVAFQPRSTFKNSFGTILEHQETFWDTKSSFLPSKPLCIVLVILISDLIGFTLILLFRFRFHCSCSFQPISKVPDLFLRNIDSKNHSLIIIFRFLAAQELYYLFWFGFLIN